MNNIVENKVNADALINWFGEKHSLSFPESNF